MPDQLRLCLDHVPGITGRNGPITDETHGFRRLGRVCEEAELGGAIALGRGGFDAGAGERIFDSMFTTKGGGMGMGLSISRSIITAHGGRIWASPGDSVGAIFRIVLPSKRSAEGEQVR
jgi:phosphoglycerate-specific signal transduction histidine kinase